MRHLLTLSFLLLAGTALAQDYVVYKVSGAVKWQNKGKQEAVAVKQTLAASDVVNLPKGGQLIVIDSKNSVQYTLTTPGTKKLSAIIEAQKGGTKKLSSMYLSYIMKQMNGKGDTSARSAVDDSYATVTRDLLDTDTLDVDTLATDSASQK